MSCPDIMFWMADDSCGFPCDLLYLMYPHDADRTGRKHPV